jgi:hypothetical protein
VPVLDSHDTSHGTPKLDGLSFSFAVDCDDASLDAYLETLLGSLRSSADTVAAAAASGDAPAPARYELTSSARPGSYDLRRDGEDVELGVPPGDAVATLVWDINRLAAECSGQHLIFHSGGLEADGTGILVPAASGSGKSTLTAGLARAGLGYLSDELVALELDGARPGRMLPYPKPITVKPGSFSVLASLDPGPFADGWFSDASVARGVEWQVPVGAAHGLAVGKPCRPAFVVVPRYDPSAGTSLTRLSETEAFFTLALHAVNMLPHGADAPGALGRLAADCECYALAMSDLDEACELVLGLVGSRVSPA